MPPEIAFYAPLKAPDHPVPSGDRTIARLMLTALDRAGFMPRVASPLRSLDRTGDAAVQARLMAEAGAEIERLKAQPRPALWFTYHCHYKAPDLLGPAMARHWGIPYVIAEPSHAPARLAGPWAGFAACSAAALKRAELLFWTTPRDRPALEALTGTGSLVALPAFLDPGAEPAPRRLHHGKLRLLVVAMMRVGDKLASYRALAAGLAEAALPVTLDVIGDGDERPAIEALLEPFGARFRGRIDDPATIRAAYEGADLLVWPGIGEGVGMLYLEAQAAALPCLAEDRPAQRAVLAPSCWLTAPGDARAFAAALREADADRAGLAGRGQAARAWLVANHSLDSAAETLRAHLMPLLSERS